MLLSFSKMTLGILFLPKKLDSMAPVGPHPQIKTWVVSTSDVMFETKVIPAESLGLCSSVGLQDI